MSTEAEAVEEAAPAAGTGAPSQKRLAPAQWLEIETLYVTGQVRAVELSRRFGISGSALSQHFQKRELRFGMHAPSLEKVASKAASKVVAKVSEVASEFAAKRKSRIEETKESHYKWAEATDKMLAGLLGTVAKNAAAIAAAPTAPRPPGPASYAEVFHDVRTLRIAKQAFELGRASRYAILDIAGEVDEAELPNLTFRDLSEADVAAMREADGLEFGDEVLDEAEGSDEADAGSED